MVEVPAAALNARSFIPEVDFFSIGTNDLTQYTLAAERGHPLLTGFDDALHPAVLRLIALVASTANRHGKWAGVCGEAAADPLAAPVFLGLGVRELSVGASSVGTPARACSQSRSQPSAPASPTLSAPGVSARGAQVLVPAGNRTRIKGLGNLRSIR